MSCRWQNTLGAREAVSKLVISESDGALERIPHPPVNDVTELSDAVIPVGRLSEMSPLEFRPGLDAALHIIGVVVSVTGRTINFLAKLRKIVALVERMVSVVSFTPPGPVLSKGFVTGNSS